MPFARPKKKPAPLDENALYDYAVVALGRRMRTVAELKRLMKSKVEPGERGADQNRRGDRAAEGVRLS